ncbi:MAG TPA: hypothetical protein VJ242_03930 [Patescibacteria group bacterium]|nr:hypothetical protein [Patescibacteria group bacterium]
MRKISFNAPGKLLLLGDHAAVYGKPCLVAAINKFVTVTVSDNLTKESAFVAAAKKLFEQKYGPVKSGFKITGFDSRYGLGSSAAVTVAVAKTMFKLKGIKPTNKQLFDFCYRVVLNVQGLGSGFDLAATVWRGVIYFVTGGKKIYRLPIEQLPLVVGYSGVKADTVTMVKKVAARITPGFLNRSTKIVNQAKILLGQKNWPVAGELMNQNQKLLKQIGVSTPKLDKLINASLEAGAYGAKLSGAGGGDCMIALVAANRRQVVEQVIARAGGQVLKIRLAL